MLVFEIIFEIGCFMDLLYKILLCWVILSGKVKCVGDSL